jgi:hypothetical protein
MSKSATERRRHSDAMTPSFLQFPTLRPGWSGREPCRVGGAIVPSSGGLGVNGPFGKRGLKPSQNYEQHESQAMWSLAL